MPTRSFLRVHKTAPPPSAPGASNGGNAYLARLVKLIPAEVVALYLTFKAAAATFLGIWSLICLGLVLLVRLLATKEDNKSPQLTAVVIAAVSFILWIYATGGYFLNFVVPAGKEGIVSVAIGVWTFIIPLFYKGD